MSTLKTLTCVAIFAACTSVSTFAAAQVASAAPAETIQTVEIVNIVPATPVQVASTRRYTVKRVVQPVPTQAAKTVQTGGKIYGRKVHATNAPEKNPTRFIYSGGPKDTQTPVYYSAEAANAR